MIIDAYFLMGIAGMLCILAGFLLIQTHKVTADSMLYDVLNFVGSALLVIYGIVGKAWPFVILNGVFTAYSLYDIAKDLEGVHTSKIRKA
ncbi:MAG: Uncharacterized protein Greene041662_89 [Candidatus Peregrinibacteria bacterium Greene0416_62]|nr:MAG: Uncharacterized protein Greene041662_89 [Candidatus Peregrinibacteria bacterium Greene0416_62]